MEIDRTDDFCCEINHNVPHRTFAGGLLLLTVTAADAQPAYSVTSLDDFNFGYSFSDRYSASGARFNDSGQILGYGTTSCCYVEIYGNGTTTIIGGRFDNAIAINNAGQVIGNTMQDGWLYSNGTHTARGSLSSSPGAGAIPYAINDAGQVAGDSDTNSGARHAFRYRYGRMHDLGTLGGTNSLATGINAHGFVTGWSDTGTGAQHAFLYRYRKMIDLGTLGGTNSFGIAINTAGQVTGTSDTQTGLSHAFLYRYGKMHDLGTLGGATSLPIDINAAGQITGWSNTDAGAQHAFLYQNGTMTDVGTLGGTTSLPTAINDAGQIVGHSNTDGDLSDHAFLFSDGAMMDLNTLISSSPLATHVTLTDAGEINNNGLIVVEGYDSQTGQTGTYLLTPLAPQP